MYFDYRLLYFIQAGLGRYLEIRYASSKTPCTLNSLTAKSDVPTKLTLEQVSIAFGFLLGGSLISLIAFLSELLHYKRQQLCCRITSNNSSNIIIFRPTQMN